MFLSNLALTTDFILVIRPKTHRLRDWEPEVKKRWLVPAAPYQRILFDCLNTRTLNSSSAARMKPQTVLLLSVGSHLEARRRHERRRSVVIKCSRGNAACRTSPRPRGRGCFFLYPESSRPWMPPADPELLEDEHLLSRLQQLSRRAAVGVRAWEKVVFNPSIKWSLT